MVEQFVQAVLKNQIATKYQHLEFPSLMYAKITKVTKTEKEYEIEWREKLKSGETQNEYIYIGNWYEYNMKVITNEGELDNNLPEIPYIHSKLQLKIGAIVLIGWVYGQRIPFIIGELQ